MKKGPDQLLGLCVSLLLLLPILVYGQLQARRPPATELTQTLFPGVTYQRQVQSAPRPYILHLVTLNLAKPGIQPFVTPGLSSSPASEATDSITIPARTTSEFAREFGLQLAINSNYFYPFSENTPWDFYPRRGDGVHAVGQTISDGTVYAAAREDWPAACFLPEGPVQIVADGTCPSGTRQAVTGREVLFTENSIPEFDPAFNKPYPRVVIATDSSGQTLWLAVIDGKQPRYSEGVTLDELTDIMRKLGASSALNVDGGGSATLVAELEGQVRVLNAPIHSKWPLRERPVANHLGFFVSKQPISEQVTSQSTMAHRSPD